MLKIKAIYDKGTSEEIEDGLIINPPFFGVIDGTSEPTHFIGEGLSFGKMSSGEMVRKVILETLYNARSNDPLEKILLRTNEKIRNIWRKSKIDPERSDLIAGAVFAFAKIDSKKINIIQGGDCLALWIKNSDKIGITKNQVYSHELQAQRLVAKLMKKHKGDRKKMWLEFYKPLCQLRLRDANKKIESGFAVLNGQSSLKACWKKVVIPISSLKLLLLFTDGFVSYTETADEMKMTKRLIAEYRKWSLNDILKRKRQNQAKYAKASHIAQDEATAVAVEFEE